MTTADQSSESDARLTSVWVALDKANALSPNDFKTGQNHLSPAFREVNYREAFRAMLDIVNRIEEVSGYADRPTAPPAEPKEASGGPGTTRTEWGVVIDELGSMDMAEDEAEAREWFRSGDGRSLARVMVTEWPRVPSTSPE